MGRTPREVCAPGVRLSFSVCPGKNALVPESLHRC